VNYDALVANIAAAMEADGERLRRAHDLADEIGEDALADALRQRGWLVTEHDDDVSGFLAAAFDALDNSGDRHG